jgi:hypothetical protein
MKTNNNKLIAEFMAYENIRGAKEHPLYKIPEHAYEVYGDGQTSIEDTFSPYFDDMKFSSSWDWLMPVVQEIGRACKSMAKDGDKSYAPYLNSLSQELMHIGSPSYMDNIYTSVINFIKAYNNLN